LLVVSHSDRPTFYVGIVGRQNDGMVTISVQCLGDNSDWRPLFGLRTDEDEQ